MKRVAFLLLVLFPLVSFSQKEAAIWYFGQYAGLDFNSGSPVVLTNGQLNTFEGCATISDYLGNLLFYTDGVTVWNKNHLVMPNGSGLLGNTSSTQSAIIVPKPGNLNQYYIFTVDDRNVTSPLSTNGIRFSTVDLTLNGGLGDIIPTQKNLTLVAQAYEKITAVKHADNNSFWVISFIQNRFLSWRVDATGVNTIPVISNVSNAPDSRGYLKISPDGKKIACANFGTAHTLMLYDFNTTTGVVSNEIQLNFDSANDIPYGVEFSTQSQKLYATTSQQTGNIHNPPGKLYQFNMASANISASRVLIHTSNINTRGALQLAIDGKIYRALSVTTTSQTGTPFLGVINNPENDGLSSNYVHNALDISNGDPNRKVVEGLPPFIQSFFLTTLSSQYYCFGDATEFTINSTAPPTSVIWDFGDPTSGSNNSSNLITPTHVFSAPGNYTITAAVTIGTSTNVISTSITILNSPFVTSPVTLIQCDDNLDGIVDFNLEEANSLISTEAPAPTITYFLNQNNATNNVNPISNPTTFSNSIGAIVWARIENSAGCFTTAQVNLAVEYTNIPSNLMVTFNECDDVADGDDTNGISQFDFSSATNQILNALLPETNLVVSYYLNIPDALAEVNPINPVNFRNSTTNSQQIVVRVDNLANECFGIGYHVTLNVNAIPQFDLQNSVDFCFLTPTHTIGIQNPAATYQYLWKNQAGTTIGNTPSINISAPGLYSVTATDTSGNNCSKTKSIQVNSMPITPLLNFGINNIQITQIATNNNTITVSATNLPPSNYQFALDSGSFQNNNVFLNVADGYHQVFIRDINNCTSTSVVAPIIEIYANNFCLGTETQFSLTSTLPPASNTVWDFSDPSSGENNSSNKFNPIHIFSNPNNYLISVDVSFGVDTFTFSKNITINPLPIVIPSVSLFECDDNLDGFENFNLLEANSLISQEIPIPQIQYFISENDAINNTNPIVNPTAFSNSITSSVWARIVNSFNCFSIAQVNLIVESILIPSDIILEFQECDDISDGSDTNGITIFNFSSATQHILNYLLPETNLNVTYYQNLTDALTKNYEINPANYRNFQSPFNQRIAIRVENTLNGCFGIGYHINLKVNAVPQFDLQNTTEFCFLTNNHEISIENPLAEYYYVWEDENGKTIGNSESIFIDFEGSYYVTATDSFGNNCIKTKVIQVTSKPITNLVGFNSTNILITDNSNNNTITIITDNLPNSQYEFAIDDGYFTDIYFYENVPAGRHFVRIRDIINCFEASVEVSLIGIPNFFTPNNDGYNDTWHVTGIDFQPTSNVYIFDRFGKLIAILDPLGPGWNGYYKGNPLPSTDYWYRVELEDGRLLRGHFSLIRR